ncbi:membrane protein insertase YidC [Nocardioides sp. dk4132]|uniref:membrane protein insertase YidC n=1 Tax=unclassified Nocardioides TaxID=2615069 RepID=UPI0012964F7F|nr:membrane protein insertase YidC [Nocardioides sp. dk4132]QGA09878.1 membrane protein insertase YidC [Nocardioides sp. dk884]
MTPLYYIISAPLVAWHWLFTQLGLDSDGGAAWVLSIIGLTLVVRAALIPLFVKQIKSSRNMQLIQPKVKELQKKYGHDRERLAQETMKLYKDSGTNPFASCLPILVQMPIFFALFRILDQAARKETAHGFLTAELARDFRNSRLFDLIPLKDSFWGARTWGDNGDLTVMLAALVLVLAMTATTFTTQRQLMAKNMPADALSGPYAQQQKMLLYVLPVAFGLGGVAFPIGVLLYWTTSNLWTMGQQFYVIRNNPAPGTPAFKAKEERDRAKAVRKGTLVEDPTAAPTEPQADRRPAVRPQPQKQTREQRKKTSKKPGGSPKSGPQGGKK